MVNNYQGRLTVATIQTNERTNIRTIVKWSKTAAILATVTVLLVAYVFVQTAHANSIKTAEQMLFESQQETSKTKTQLKEVQSEKTKLDTDIQVKAEKIHQLEQENAELKG